MEGWIPLLIFAALFFVMMRYGCGRHMMQSGHAHHGMQRDTDTPHTTDNKQQSIDPVCGMTVQAGHGYIKLHHGRQYHFCSRDCLDRFETDSARYLSQPSHDEHHEGGQS